MKVKYIASGIKLTYDEVNKTFEDLGFKLLTKKYINAHQKLKIQDKYGYLYSINYSNIHANKVPQFVSCFNPYSIYNIKQYIINNKLNVELVSNKYEGNNSFLIFKCNCGNIYKCSWDKFSSRRKILCNECSLIKKGLERRISKTEAYYEFLNAGYIIDKNKYAHSEEKILCTTQDGYKGFFTLRELRYGNRFQYFNISNPFTIENIKNYISINDLDCILISDKYVEANKAKLHFKCACGNDFYVSWTNFQNRLNYTCNDCLHISSLERKTMDFLNENSIVYEKEYPISNIKSNRNLRFDFKLKYKDKILIIECDGIGHFEPIEYWGGISGLKAQKERDKIKNDYCKKNNIPLLRIPYWEFNNSIQYKDTILKFLKNKSI